MEVPISVHMPPSIEENDNGISSTEMYKSELAAQVSQGEISIATIGVLLRKPEKTATGAQSRSRAAR